MLKELLQGKPFKHPLHPALVHLPVGLFMLSLLLDIATMWMDNANALVRGAFYSMAFGLIAAGVAAIPGLVDWFDIRADHPAKKPATYHMALNLFVVGLYVVNFGLRFNTLDAVETPVVPLALSLAALGLLSYSGYLGGVLIYDNGIAVGRHRRHTETPSRTLHLSATTGEGGLVPVIDIESLGEGETLRVELDGNVIAIVKLDHQFYAFQEFCTHRYGPLSEGSFHEGQVECPWHRSCFDVRTGKVTHAPAKVDLKTYEVVVRGRQLLIRLPQEALKEHAVVEAIR